MPSDRRDITTSLYLNLLGVVIMPSTPQPSLLEGLDLASETRKGDFVR
jgi:hypothetical protein